MILAIDASLPQEVLDSCYQLCGTFANVAGDDVLLAAMDPETLDDLRAWMLGKTAGEGMEGIEPRPAVSNAPMSAAPFVYRDDGRPDWAAMWEGFCELALYGGPPHRGADNPVTADEAPEATAETEEDMIPEIRRGIWETTGLFSEPADENWLAVTCHSKRMAAWMCAAIILENVDARCEDEILYVPANPNFDLKNQVKSVITVVAKVNHYWQAHVAEQQSLEQSA
jgi:sirohydrochlorin cobaltochelatase